MLSVCWQVEVMEFYQSRRTHSAALLRNRVTDFSKLLWCLKLNKHYRWWDEFSCNEVIKTQFSVVSILICKTVWVTFCKLSLIVVVAFEPYKLFPSSWTMLIRNIRLKTKLESVQLRKHCTVKAAQRRTSRSGILSAFSGFSGFFCSKILCFRTFWEVSPSNYPRADITPTSQRVK